MLTTLLLTAGVIMFTIIVIATIIFFRKVLINFDHITGYILDRKVDTIFEKATIIAELYAQEKQTTEAEKISFAYERAKAITADVLLQNGLNPRRYHLEALVRYFRYSYGFKQMPVGGEQNGKS